MSSPSIDGYTKKRARTGGIRRALTATAAAAGALALLAGCAAPSTTMAAPEVRGPAAENAADTEGALTKNDVDTWLDGVLPASLENADIAGATVSVVSDGELLTARGYGYADTKEQTPVDPEKTLFRVGSISKLFTDTAVMQLVESGDLDLDADISDYLDFPVPRNFDDPITLRNLLTHTAGFEERIDGLIRYSGTPSSLHDTLSQDPPEQVYKPGTTPAYSNYGNGLAGYIVQKVSGVPFEQYLHDEVLSPLGMASSSFEQPLPDALADRMSAGYETAHSPATPFELVSPAPAGALATTATDMAPFMLAHLGDSTEGSPILDDDTRTLMHEPALTADTLGNLAEGPRMTLGFFDESRNGHRIIGHGGDTNVFHSHLQLYPDDDTGIFVSLNSSGNSPTATLDVLNAVMHGFTDRYFPAQSPQKAASSQKAGSTQKADSTQQTDAVSPETSRKHAQMAQGTYASTRTFHSTYLATAGLLTQMQVAAQPDGTIVLTPDVMSTDPAVYHEVAPWLWQKVGGQQTISMRVADGQVQTIGFESAFSLNRVDAAHNAGLALPVLIGSVLILLIGVLAWPITALTRRHYRRPHGTARQGITGQGTTGRTADRALRLSRMGTRIGAVLALAALISWVVIIQTVMELTDVSGIVVRITQIVQAVGVLAIVPAVIWLVRGVRQRIGWWRIAGTALMLVALAAVAWFAFTFQLLAPSISI